MPINEAGQVIDPQTRMRDRDGMDHYPTPAALALAALRVLVDPYPPDPRAPHPVPTPPEPFAFRPTTILDPGAGTGPWGRAARTLWPDSHLSGVELAVRPADPAYDLWMQDDYLTWQPRHTFDLICGNPPYRLAEAFIQRGLGQLKVGGVLVFLLRLAFVEGRGRYDRLWGSGPLAEVATCVERPSYTLDGKTDATAYACFYWYGHAKSRARISWLSWKPDPRAADPAQTHMFGKEP